MKSKNSHKHISSAERDEIALRVARGQSLREISRCLNRSVSTISTEIKRNSYKGTYVAIHAHEKSNKRKQNSHVRETLKDTQTYAYVIDKLKQGWSPEQISGRLKREQGKQVICHETIYSYIYSQEAASQKLWEYLPRKQKKRKQKGGRQVHKSRIPQRISIHDRPKEVNERTLFGHWEGDSIEGAGHKGGIRTEVERLSRFTQAVKIERIGAQETIAAEFQIFTDMPPHCRLSTTWDNGKEGMQHQQLHELGMNTYFADPYCSWQRGCNENHNGLVRRYLPKKTSFANLTQSELDDIVWEINNRPRKVLQFATPQEVFEIYSGVRILPRM